MMGEGRVQLVPEYPQPSAPRPSLWGLAGCSTSTLCLSGQAGMQLSPMPSGSAWCGLQNARPAPAPSLLGGTQEAGSH